MCPRVTNTPPRFPAMPLCPVGGRDLIFLRDNQSPQCEVLCPRPADPKWCLCHSHSPPQIPVCLVCLSHPVTSHLYQSSPCPFSPHFSPGSLSVLLLLHPSYSLCLSFPSPPAHLPPTLDELTQGSVTPVTQAGAQGAGSGSALPGHLGAVEVCTMVTTQVVKAGQVFFTEACAETLQEHQWLLVVELAQDGHLLLLGQVRLSLLLAAYGQAAGSHSTQHSAHFRGLSPGGVIVQGPWLSFHCFFLVQGSGWNRYPAQLSPVPRTGSRAVCGERGDFLTWGQECGGEWVLSPSLTPHLLSTHSNLGTVLGPRDTTVNKKLTF